MRKAAWALVALLVFTAGRAVAQDLTTVGDLAELLSAEDHREFDAGLMQRTAQSPDSLVRLKSAVAMGRIGDRLALPLLLRLLQDPDTSVRIEAAFALGQLKDPGAVADLTHQLDLLDNAAAGAWPTELATALCKIGGPEADAALVRLLQRHPPDGPTEDRATAAALLESWRMGRSTRTAGMLPEYVHRSSGDWRQNAAYAAGRLALPAAAPFLLDATSDTNPGTVLWALRGLTASLADSAHLRHGAFTDRIRVLLNDTNPLVRINALRAIATFADSTLAPYVATRLIDRDPNVPVQAALSLGALGGSAAVAALRQRLADPGTFATQRALLLGLAEAAPDTALAAADSLKHARDWRLRFLYVEVVGTAANAAAGAAALAMTADPDARVVAAALGAVGQASDPGDTAAIRVARGALDNPDYGVRSAAIDLLARERDPDFVPLFVAAYRRAAADRENDARLSAVNALAGIARVSPAARARVEAAFLALQPRSGDYLVRRLVAQRFGMETYRRYWGTVGPVETGRSPEDYREAVRRYILGSAAAGSMQAVVETDRGTMVIQLMPFEAPLTVDNFVRLVDRRYFDNGRWHRVVPNFVIQDGDPRGDGSGGPGTVIRDEINRRRYDNGVVGMALSGPDTGGSQFFICHSPQPHLDGTYTVFGLVVSGGDVLMQIVQGDRIRRIYR